MDPAFLALSLSGAPWVWVSSFSFSITLVCRPPTFSYRAPMRDDETPPEVCLPPRASVLPCLVCVAVSGFPVPSGVCPIFLPLVTFGITCKGRGGEICLKPSRLPMAVAFRLPKHRLPSCQGFRRVSLSSPFLCSCVPLSSYSPSCPCHARLVGLSRSLFLSRSPCLCVLALSPICSAPRRRQRRRR